MSHPFRSMASRFAVMGIFASFVAAQEGPLSKVVMGDIVTDAVDSFGLAWGDLNGDTAVDVLVVSGPSSDNLLYFGVGDGTFVRVPAGVVVSDNANSSDVAFADIDGDGDLDIFVTNRFGASNALYRNQGGIQGGAEGAFVRDFADASVNAIGNSECCLFDDFDGDGDVDLFVGNTGGGNNFLFSNNGGAQLGTEGEFTQIILGVAVSDAGDTFGCTSGDYDGDGDVDLFIANGSGENNVLYANSGTGLFTKATSVVVSQQGGNSRDAVLADIDDDGDLDLVVANFLENNFVYRNRGGDQGGTEGVYDPLPGTALALQAASSSAAIAAADWDADGDLDIVIANCCGQTNDFFETKENWVFQKVVAGDEATDGGYSNDVGFADIEGDGDLDLLIANSFDSSGARVNFLYTNGFVAGAFASLGPGIAGTAGVPLLNGSGALKSNESVTFFTAGALPSTVTILVVGLSNISTSFKGGTLYPDPLFQIPIPTDATGFWFVTSPWPVGFPSGFDVFYQTWVPDAGATKGFAASNGLQSTTPQY